MIQSPGPNPSEEPVSGLVLKGVLVIVGTFIVAWVIVLFRLVPPL